MMNQSAPPGTQQARRIASAMPWVALFVLLILFYLRNAGLYPIVFTDEWVYSKGARLAPLAEATAPSYLYLFIYSITKSCGRDFLDCARMLNTIFFLAAIPLIYLVARKVSSPKAAAVVAALSAVSPISSYTAYFMPESMYFFCFWLFVWFSLEHGGARDDARHASIGLLVGIMTLVKVHAFFLGFAYIAFVLLTRLQSAGDFWSRRLALGVFRFIAAMLAVRLGGGYLLAGTNGLNLTGSDYAPNAAAMLSMHDYPRLISLALQNVTGHLLALAVLFALPMTSLPGLIAMPSRQAPPSSANTMQVQRTIAILTVAVLVPLIAITSFYTASIAGVGPYESIGRIHARYYNFAFPLLLVIAASQTQTKEIASTVFKSERTIPTLLAGTALAYALITGMSSYVLSIVDCPELVGLVTHRAMFTLITAAALVNVAVWHFRRALGARVFLFALMPAIVAITSTHATYSMRQRSIPDAYDRAGIFTHNYLDHQAASRLVIMGPELGYLYRTLFHVDSPLASVKPLSANPEVDVKGIGRDRDWLLLIDSTARVANPEFEINGAGYRLIKLAIDRNIDFSKSSWPGVLARTNGLSVAEDWGTWSTGKVVKIEFLSPLPRSFVVRLQASAYGPNIGQSFQLRAGAVQRSFVLTESPGEVRIAVDGNHDGTRELEIQIPQPTSPKSLGASEDARALGIALKSLLISHAQEPGRE